MKQVKVKQVETYKDSQGEHIVCKGKLVLLECKYRDEIGAIYLPREEQHGIYYKPIIISETEEFKGEDIVYCEKGYIGKFHEIETLYGVYKCFKILALPENFSPKHLQAIIDGKLKDGDEVLVELENIRTNNKLYPNKSNRQFDNNYFIKLVPTGYIKLFSYSKEETWDNIFNNNNVDETKYELMERLKNSYLPPKRK